MNEARCYCTIRPLRTGSHSYVLCIEHLGGLVPLLIGRQFSPYTLHFLYFSGRQVNRFLPQFHISIHPQTPVLTVPLPGSSAQVGEYIILFEITRILGKGGKTLIGSIKIGILTIWIELFHFKASQKLVFVTPTRGNKNIFSSESGPFPPR